MHSNTKEKVIHGMELMDFTFEALTFENCDKAYEIDRADIPEAFVDEQKTEKHERYNYLKAELLKKLEEL